MVEPLMYVALGFLLASFLAVLFFPVVHNRAVRLTVKRVQAAAPFSLAEMQADKDQLRAEFAIANRRLEMMVEAARDKAAAQMAELGERTEAVSRLKGEVETKAATVAGLESTVKRLTETLAAATREVELKRTAAAEAERDAADARAKLAEAESRYGESAMANDRQRIEMVALQTQIGTLKDRLADLERALAQAERRAAEAQAEAAVRAAQEIVGPQDAEAELRREFASLQRQHQTALETARIEKLQVQAQLERMREERAGLQRELEAAKRGAGAPAGGEEAAILRDRVSHVAAEVARLTAALEGPGSPVETMMRREMGGAANGADGTALPSGATPHPAAASLADRMRALQERAGPARNAG